MGCGSSVPVAAVAEIDKNDPVIQDIWRLMTSGEVEELIERLRTAYSLNTLTEAQIVEVLRGFLTPLISRKLDKKEELQFEMLRLLIGVMKKYETSEPIGEQGWTLLFLNCGRYYHPLRIVCAAAGGPDRLLGMATAAQRRFASPKSYVHEAIPAIIQAVVWAKGRTPGKFYDSPQEWAAAASS